MEEKLNQNQLESLIKELIKDKKFLEANKQLKELNKNFLIYNEQYKNNILWYLCDNDQYATFSEIIRDQNLLSQLFNNETESVTALRSIMFAIIRKKNKKLKNVSIYKQLKNAINIMDRNDNEDGKLFIHQAIEINDCDLVKELMNCDEKFQIQQAKIVFKNSQDQIHYNSITLSAKIGCVECLKLFLNIGIDKKDNLKQFWPEEHMWSVGGGNIIHICLEHNNIKILYFMIDNFFKEKHKILYRNYNDSGLQPIHLAAKKGNRKALKLLLSEKLNDLIKINDEDQHLKTPIYYAIQYAIEFKSTEIINLLLDYGIHPQITPDMPQIIKNQIAEYQQRAKIEHIENLVFKGGGPKGIAYGGVYRFLDEDINYQILHKVKRIAGSSAGAITACLIAMGGSYEYVDTQIKINFLDQLDISEEFQKIATTQDYKNLFASKDFSQFFKSAAKQQLYGFVKKFAKPIGVNLLTGNYPAIIGNVKEGIKDIYHNIVGVLKTSGLCKGNKFLNLIGQWIKTLTGDENLTFGELAEKVRNSGGKLKHLHITGTMLKPTSDEEVVMCSWSSENESDADLIIRDAVRISMSFPGIFSPHNLFIKRQGKRIPFQSEVKYVDGGLLNNLPIALFDNKPYLKGEGARNKKTLAFSFKEFSQQNLTQQQLVTCEQNNDKINLKSLSLDLINLYFDGQDHQLKVYEEGEDRIIQIDSKGVNISDFGLNEYQKQELEKSGYNSIDNFFKKKRLENQIKFNGKLTGLEKIPYQVNSLRLISEKIKTDLTNNKRFQIRIFSKDQKDMDMFLNALFGRVLFQEIMTSATAVFIRNNNNHNSNNQINKYELFEAEKMGKSAIKTKEEPIITGVAEIFAYFKEWNKEFKKQEKSQNNSTTNLKKLHQIISEQNKIFILECPFPFFEFQKDHYNNDALLNYFEVIVGDPVAYIKEQKEEQKSAENTDLQELQIKLFSYQKFIPSQNENEKLIDRKTNLNLLILNIPAPKDGKVKIVVNLHDQLRRYSEFKQDLESSDIFQDKYFSKFFTEDNTYAISQSFQEILNSVIQNPSNDQETINNLVQHDLQTLLNQEKLSDQERQRILQENDIQEFTNSQHRKDLQLQIKSNGVIYQDFDKMNFQNLIAEVFRQSITLILQKFQK